MGYRWGTGGGSGLHAMGVKVGNHPHPTGWDRACRDGIGPVGMGSGLSGWDRACRDGIGPVRMGSRLRIPQRAFLPRRVDCVPHDIELYDVGVQGEEDLGRGDGRRLRQAEGAEGD